MDRSTLSNYDEVITTSIDLDLRPDFEASVLHGIATLDLKTLVPGLDAIVLDTRSVSVSKATLVGADGEQDLPFQFGAARGDLGQALELPLPHRPVEGTDLRVRVHYHTAAGQACSALQWLTPGQTADGKGPFLFSQCQAIHARAMLPCQDSPAVKAPYTARVTVDDPKLTALMSAVPRDADAASEGKACFSFAQEVPIPSYLIALAVGVLESRELGPRSRVWAEPSAVDACASEFEDTEKFVSTAEDICGPYVWGRYDLLVLPPSFPYGGMENPCLTFVTPTLIAGDKSMVNVCCHEIAHSWTGNLVTNKTWNHFWMNEGFTVYVERKIVRRLFGEVAYHTQTALGHRDLCETCRQFGEQHKWTQLYWPLRGEDPDDAFSKVPYEKGYCLLRHLEDVVGGEDAFLPFLREYLSKFARAHVTADDFRALFNSYFTEQGLPAEKLDAVDWHGWLFSPGTPEAPSFDDSYLKAARALADAWLAAGSAGPDSEARSAFDSFAVDQKMVFLSALEDGSPSKALCAAIDDAYALTTSGNSEILCSWVLLALKAGYEPAVPAATAFAARQGRMKYVRPLYRALVQVKPELARETFRAHKHSYHAIAAKMLARDLGVDE